MQADLNIHCTIVQDNLNIQCMHMTLIRGPFSCKVSLIMLSNQYAWHVFGSFWVKHETSGEDTYNSLIDKYRRFFFQ